MQILDRVVSQTLKERCEQLEKRLEGHVVAFYGPISSAYLRSFINFVENVKGQSDQSNRLIIVLNTPGGEVEAVEKMVETIRWHYKEVFFVVPHIAMSAGTIFCMSGDKIYMDYTSSLGPIDPQVMSKDGRWVPALGYLDKFNEILDKSKKGTLTDVEFAIAQNQDLAVLRRYEQARDLSITLLQDWLVRYKFKHWTKHRSDVGKRGQEVTEEEKRARAREIADMLGNNGTWHSHGRMIGVNTLRKFLRLEIDDYTDDPTLRESINSYHDLLVDYVQRQGWAFFLHGKDNFGE